MRFARTRTDRHNHREVVPVRAEVTLVKPPVFRDDINGLRAWAVVAVVLYHFGVPGFGGGFSGVDVFFAISGFLMTGIVVTGLEQKKGFSLAGFYLARARRIFPALIVLCLVLAVLGWFFMIAPDYRAFGTQVVASLAFVSNITFWKETGYFDASAYDKWLLHTWSLSVEWQFYLLLPLVLLAAWKWRPGRATVTWVLAIGLTASLALSILLTPRIPSAAFYLLPTRAWEMLAGGLVFLLGPGLVLSSRWRLGFEATGFGMMLAAICLFDTSDAWPGWGALLPVAGTLLVLLAARSGSAWTGHRVVQWLGTRSYSLYLWHWPIVVALAYLQFTRNFTTICVGIAAAMLLGHLSYRLIEAPARRRLTHWRLKTAATALGVATMAVALPAAAIRAQDGIRGRFSPTVERVADEAFNFKPERARCFTQRGVESASCMYGGTPLRAILLGDSHADAVTTALAAAVPPRGGGIMDWSYIRCPTLMGVRSAASHYVAEQKCSAFLEWAVDQLKQVPADVPLVIVNRTSSYAVGAKEFWKAQANVPSVYFSEPRDKADAAFLNEFTRGITDTACLLAKDRPVYLVRPIPEMGINVPEAMSRAMVLGRRADIGISVDEYHKRHDFVWAAQDAAHERCGVRILDVLPYLCADGRCSASRDGRPLYYDQDHLSEFGNRLLVPMFATVFESASQGTDAGDAPLKSPQ